MEISEIIFCIVMFNAIVHVLSTTVVQFVVAANSRMPFSNDRVYCVDENRTQAHKIRVNTEDKRCDQIALTI